MFWCGFGINGGGVDVFFDLSCRGLAEGGGKALMQR
jgi:hypothetical protein